MLIVLNIGWNISPHLLGTELVLSLSSPPLGNAPWVPGAGSLSSILVDPFRHRELLRCLGWILVSSRETTLVLRVLHLSMGLAQRWVLFL